MLVPRALERVFLTLGNIESLVAYAWMEGGTLFFFYRHQPHYIAFRKACVLRGRAGMTYLCRRVLCPLTTVSQNVPSRLLAVRTVEIRR